MHGHGRFRWPDGQTYVGSYRNGLRWEYSNEWDFHGYLMGFSWDNMYIYIYVCAYSIYSIYVIYIWIKWIIPPVRFMINYPLLDEMKYGLGESFCLLQYFAVP